jgi:hypothetical protein
VSAGRWLRVTLAGTGVVALAATARADAPLDQYGLFDMSAQTIQDVRTGLIWQRSAPAQTMSFYDAASYCAGLSLATPSGTSSGWRVPSYKELLTLVDETPHTEYVGDGLIQVWIDANAFPQTSVTPTPDYWTSSLYVIGEGAAYVVSFSEGIGDQQSTGTDLQVRCVHDP